MVCVAKRRLRRRNTYLNTYDGSRYRGKRCPERRRVPHPLVFHSQDTLLFCRPRRYGSLCWTATPGKSWWPVAIREYTSRAMAERIDQRKILYSVDEAATLLSLSRGTVYKLIHTGQILAVYPTSKTRISASALQRFVAQLESSQRTQRDKWGRSVR